MLKPQHLFATTLFFLFIYLFGYDSFCKYLRGNTIVIETVEKTSDIPAPAITLVPYWKYDFQAGFPIDPFLVPNNTCWYEEVYECFEANYTYSLNELLVNTSAFNWTSRFEPLRSMLFTLNSASTLSTKVSEALSVEVVFETWPLVNMTEDILWPDPDVLPSFYLHDERYFVYTKNPRLISQVTSYVTISFTGLHQWLK